MEYSVRRELSRDVPGGSRQEGHAKRGTAWRVALTYKGRPQSMLLGRQKEAVRDLFWVRIGSG